jgi:hypothetical protein
MDDELPRDAPAAPGTSVSRTHDWWRRRSVAGVHNWELVLILGAAVVAGIVATIGSSLVGVR